MLLRRGDHATSVPTVRAARRPGGVDAAPVGQRGRRRTSAPAGELDAVVLDADERQGLVCVRSLGRAGLRVGAFGSAHWSPAFGSRWAAVTGRVPEAADAGALVDAVQRIVDMHAPRAVLAGTDGTVEALHACRSAVAGRTFVALAPEAALDVALDKARTLELARRLGIGVPRTVVVDSLEDMSSAVEEVGVPAVVKPSRSWLRGSGERVTAAVAVTVEEAVALGQRPIGDDGAVVVQELVTGSREAVSLLVAGGAVAARFAQVAHRMYPLLGGSSIVRESIAVPEDLRDAADRLAAAAGLEGYAEVEFRRDAQGRARLMEINPRLSASVEVAVRAGVDFPRMLYEWATTGTVARAPSAYREGVRMRWLGGDIRWLRDALLFRGRPEAPPVGRALAAFAADSLRPASYDYLTFSDLRPAVRAVVGFAGKAVARRGGLAPSSRGTAGSS